jgi:hypothetical protein
MIPREYITRVISMHQQLDDPMDGVIWLRQDDNAAWLLEILPDIPDEYEVMPPYVYGPHEDFPYVFNLIAGSFVACVRGIQNNLELAQWISQGEIMLASKSIDELVKLAGAPLGP